MTPLAPRYRDVTASSGPSSSSRGCARHSAVGVERSLGVRRDGGDRSPGPRGVPRAIGEALVGGGVEQHPPVVARFGRWSRGARPHRRSAHPRPAREAVRRSGLRPEHEPHVVFQTSTLDALFEGDFDGDLTFAELAEHGDFGLGTLNGLDGEMLALDGRFLRADVDGAVSDVPSTAQTPFAVVTFFDPVVEFTLDGALNHDDSSTSSIARRCAAPVCAVRVDGRFDHVRARSVPRFSPPYSAADRDRPPPARVRPPRRRGTIVGFRFPAYAQGSSRRLPPALRRRRAPAGSVRHLRTRSVTVRMDHAMSCPSSCRPPGSRTPTSAWRHAKRTGA